MKPASKDEKPSGSDDLPAREHSAYAQEDERQGEPHPREEGDYNDPVKDITGRGNASKGPYEEQGGAGHGENYGAREKPRAKPDSGQK